MGEEARSEVKEKRYANAVARCSEGLALFPRSIHLYLTRAEALLAQNLYDSAIDDTERLLELLCHESRGVSSRTAGQKRILARIYTLRKRVFVQMGRPDEALVNASVAAALQGTQLDDDMLAALVALDKKADPSGTALKRIESSMRTGSFLRPLAFKLQGAEQRDETDLSEDTLKSLEEMLKCPLCIELLYRPTTLPCGHSLCTHCLARYGLSAISSSCLCSRA